MKSFKKGEILEYVGETDQLFGIKDYTYNSGTARGVRALEVNNGSGMQFTVLPDRALDISALLFKGTNVCFHNNCGVVDPRFFDYKGLDFCRNFTGGLVSTCGLTQVGGNCIDNGEELGLHGRHMATPADQVTAKVEWINDEPYIKIGGVMKEAALFAENLVMTREMICKVGENEITINDTVENYGFTKEPLMILYHCNFGYPLLDEDAYVVIPTNSIVPRDKGMKGVLIEPEKYNVFQKPTQGYREQVFFHDLKTDAQGNTCVAVINEKLELGVAIYFNKNQLDRFTHWKMMGKGTYVLGLEPGNSFVVGRIKERENGTLKYIEPRETKKFSVKFKILDGTKKINEFTKQTSEMK